MVKITQCQGEGQGSCKRCNDKGIWNANWMCFLYKIEGFEGCYCEKCVKEILREEEKMGYCKNECPDGETTCCICCDKQGGCDNRCDMMDSYEYAEDCEDYVEEDES